MRNLIVFSLMIVVAGLLYYSAKLQRVRVDDTALKNNLVLQEAEKRNKGARIRFEAEKIIAANVNTDLANHPAVRVQIITRLQKAARAGDAKAMYELGEIYFDKPGYVHDSLTSFGWFAQAYEKGYPDAGQQLLRFCPNWKGTLPELSLTAVAAAQQNKTASEKIQRTCAMDTWL